MKRQTNYHAFLRLLVCCLIGFSSLWSYTATAVTIGSLEYSLDESSKEATVTGPASSSVTSVVIPESVSYNSFEYAVTSIGSFAFSGCSNLKEVTIPNSITSIDEYAFVYCSNLTEVIIPNSVTEIGEDAFYGCAGLTKASFASIESLCRIEFGSVGSNPLCYANHLYIDGTEVTSIIISKEIPSIGNYAFSGCTGLKNLIIEDGENELALGSNSDTNSDKGLFYDCPLESVYLGRNLSYRTDIGYVSPFYSNKTLTSLTIGNSVTSIGYSAFRDCSSLTEVTIGNSVTSIGYSAFRDCSSLTEVTIPNSVAEIGEDAFYGCTGLTEVTIPNSVTEIGKSAFQGCTGLKNLIIEDGENELSLGSTSSLSGGEGLFYDCPLESVYLGRNLSYSTSWTTGYSPFYYKKTLTSLTIGSSVTEIGENAFKDCYSLKEVTIPNSVTSIGESAFSACSSLTEVTIPTSVTSIGNDAFNDCTGLKNLKIEDGEKTLELGYSDSYSISSGFSDKGLFYDCPLENLYLGRSLSYSTEKESGYSPFYSNKTLTSLTIGNSVTEIGNYAFSGCSGLTELTIPNSVISIGNYAFDECNGIKSLVIEDGGNELALGYNSFSSTVTGEGLFYDCPLESLYLGRNLSYSNSGYSPFYSKKTLTSLTIGNSVTEIGKNAFRDCRSLTEVTIPNSVTKIGDCAFYGCSNLTEVIIPNSVTSIGGYAFHGWDKLTEVTIPNSVTEIGNSAFSGCTGLKNLIIEDGENELALGYNSYSSSTCGLFYDCPLESVYLGRNLSYQTDTKNHFPFCNKNTLTTLTIGNYVTSIGNDAFNGCTGLKNLIIEDGEKELSLGYYTLTSSWNGLFYDCPLENIYLGRNLHYGSSPFYSKETLISLTIGNSVTSIEYKVFSGCSSLTSLTIGNSVTSIGSYAFEGCTGLTSLTIGDSVTEIGNSVTSIGKNAFSGCSSLTELTIGNSVTSIGDYAFSNCSSLPEVSIPNSVTEIGGAAFYGCTSLKEVTIPNSVTEIGGAAFYGCTSLKEVTIPNSVTEIGGSAFEGCSSLTEVTIPNSVTSIGSYAFSGCTSLPEVTIPNSVTSIGYSAFYGCTSLTEVTIPNSVTEIGSSAFSGCTSLTEVTIPNSVTSIGGAAFRDCSRLTEVTIPNSVTKIGDSAFYGCSSLTEVTIPNSVTSIDWGAFRDCSSLKEVTIPNSVTSIVAYAFSGCSGLKNLIIEDGENELALGSTCLFDCPLKSVYLGRNITSNSTSSPFPYSIRSLTIGKFVGSLDKISFQGCYNLRTIIIESFKIDGIDKCGLLKDADVIVRPPFVTDDICSTQLTYFDKVLVEYDDNTYTFVSAPSSFTFENCIASREIWFLVDCDKISIARCDEKTRFGINIRKSRQMCYQTDLPLNRRHIML